MARLFWRPRARFLNAILLLGSVAFIACAAPAAPRESADSRAGSGEAAARTAGPKRVTIAIRGEPRTISTKIDSSPSVPGGADVETMLHAGTTLTDADGKLRPQLAEIVPSVENGLWTVAPDGRMETTWRLRPNARWHDGQPITTADLLFTLQVVRDPNVPEFRDAAFESIESAEARDERTLIVRWKRPYIGADTLFSFNLAPLMAKHRLEPTFLEDRASFTQSPAWGGEFVGAGPFRLQDWVRGSYMTIAANPDYVLGRPKLDEIEVRFVEDANTFMANMLAGTVDLNLGGRNISLEQAQDIRGQWNGHLEIRLNSRFVAQPQYLNPNPAIVGDVRFRRALIHGVDRVQLAESLLPGAPATVAHLFLSPSEPEYAEWAPALVTYEYDPRRATQEIEALGYTRGGDGFFRDAAGQRLSVEIRTVATDINQKIMLTLADAWQRIGVGAEPNVVPPQRQRDLPYRATFPAFDMQRQPSQVDTLYNLYSYESRLPETNFVGRNYSRYTSPQLDALLDRYFTTIAWPARMEVGRQIAQHVSDQIVWLDLFYDAQPVMVSARLKNVKVGKAAGAQDSWNANEWDVP
jgi:peptide/nickel transport system substrate-binding protein